MQFWEPATHEPLGEVFSRDLRFDEIAFSPDGSLAVLGGGGTFNLVEPGKWRPIRKLEEPTRHLSAPRFTPDGKYLVLQAIEPSPVAFDPRMWKPVGLCVFDTRSWQRVGRLPDAPDDAAQYFSAPRKRRAVVCSTRGTISLWDLDRRATVAELDRGCRVSEAAFAPDESLVAVVTIGPDVWRNVRIRLWKTGAGEFIRELRPFEQTTCERVQGLLWSPDGRYLLAATRSTLCSSEGISMWNVRTGRHRGEFTGCPSNVNGVVLLPGGSELVAGCDDGIIRFWDFEAATKRIGDFENSPSSH
jgi:WD40 repeat protein